MGELNLPMLMRERDWKSMKLQACPVAKPLASVKRICMAGHAVIFDEEGSYIVNKTTGSVTQLREEDGNYMLDVYVPPPKSNKMPFAGQS